VLFAAGVVGFGIVVYRLLVRGSLTLDLRLGRTVRPLGPLELSIAAPRELVFDLISQPYLGRTSRTLASKLEVLERGSDMVLAAHFTPVGRMVATTVEIVRFVPPSDVHFRLVQGPVPHVVERFELHEDGGSTVLEYRGELGADLWALGRWWGDRVARRWEAAVAGSLETVKIEAERRAG
jgi:Polyketide cyclase / dehydrase and lipid transport